MKSFGLPMEGLGPVAQAAWERAWELAVEKHPKGLVPTRITQHPLGQGPTYKVETYTLEWIGPEWYNLSCSCPAAEFGRVCHHRAIVAQFRLTEAVPSGPLAAPHNDRCPWCQGEGVITPAGYHPDCEVNLLTITADRLREDSRAGFHAELIRHYYARSGLIIPMPEQKYDPLRALYK